MIKKLKTLICCRSESISCSETKEQIALEETKKFVDTKSKNITIEIEWDDILNSTPNSNTDSIISKAMRRSGYYGHVTESLLILENGEEYIPNELSDHWEAFLGSAKFKPKVITYSKLL
jgi:hypothetical protein